MNKPINYMHYQRKVTVSIPDCDNEETIELAEPHIKRTVDQLIKEMKWAVKRGDLTEDINCFNIAISLLHEREEE